MAGLFDLTGKVAVVTGASLLSCSEVKILTEDAKYFE